MTDLIKYDTDSGVGIELSADTVKRHLVRGNGTVSDQEVMMFLELCRAQRLNPFVNDAYLIKYGSSPASIVTGWQTFLKRAEKHEQFDGYEAGVVVLSPDRKQVVRRQGTLILPDEQLVGGWAKVYRKDRGRHVEIELNLSEYDKQQSIWKTMPGTMIRKTALSQGLREAFPDALAGLYSGEELGADADTAPAPTGNVVEVQVVETSRDLSALSELKAQWAARFEMSEKSAGMALMVLYGDPRDMDDEQYDAMLAAIEERLAPADMAAEDIEF